MEGPLSSLLTFAFSPLYLSRKEDRKKRQAAWVRRSPSPAASPRLQRLDMGLLQVFTFGVLGNSSEGLAGGGWVCSGIRKENPQTGSLLL